MSAEQPNPLPKELLKEAQGLNSLEAPSGQIIPFPQEEKKEEPSFTQRFTNGIRDWIKTPLGKIEAVALAAAIGFGVNAEINKGKAHETPAQFTTASAPLNPSEQTSSILPASPPVEQPALSPKPPEPKPELKAEKEKKYPSGSVERYGMVTEKNFGEYFVRIKSKKELDKLMEEQPGLPLFSVTPKSDKFSMGEYERVGEYQGISIKVYCTDMAIYSPASYNKITYIGPAKLTNGASSEVVVNSINGKDSSVFDFGSNSGPNFSLEVKSAQEIKTDFPYLKYLVSSEKIEPGRLLATYKGPETVSLRDRNNQTQTEPGGLGLEMSTVHKLDPSEWTKRPDGGIKKQVTENTTPSLAKPEQWLHVGNEQTGYKIAVYDPE